MLFFVFLINYFIPIHNMFTKTVHGRSATVWCFCWFRLKILKISIDLYEWIFWIFFFVFSAIQIFKTISSDGHWFIRRTLRGWDHSCRPRRHAALTLLVVYHFFKWTFRSSFLLGYVCRWQNHRHQRKLYYSWGVPTNARSISIPFRSRRLSRFISVFRRRIARKMRTRWSRRCWCCSSLNPRNHSDKSGS